MRRILLEQVSLGYFLSWSCHNSSFIELTLDFLKLNIALKNRIKIPLLITASNTEPGSATFPLPALLPVRWLLPGDIATETEKTYLTRGSVKKKCHQTNVNVCFEEWESTTYSDTHSRHWMDVALSAVLQRANEITRTTLWLNNEFFRLMQSISDLYTHAVLPSVCEHSHLN